MWYNHLEKGVTGMLNLTHRYAMRNMTRKRMDEVRKAKMTGDELLKAIRTALPCPIEPSVSVQAEDNPDVITVRATLHEFTPVDES